MIMSSSTNGSDSDSDLEKVTYQFKSLVSERDNKINDTKENLLNEFQETNLGEAKNGYHKTYAKLKKLQLSVN